MTETPRQIQPGEIATIEIEEIPPSVNQLWRHHIVGNHTITYLSTQGKEYREKLQQAIPRWIQPTNKPIWIRIYIMFPTKRKQDLDNHLKAVIDALKQRVYDDDDQIVEIQAFKMYEKNMPATRIELGISQ